MTCQLNASSTLVHRRQLWPATVQHWTVLSVGGGVSTEYKLTQIQYLLNVGPASQVLASIHSALVKSSCWQECVHIVYNAPMPLKCWPASYTMAWHHSNACYTDTMPGQWWACVANTGSGTMLWKAGLLYARCLWCWLTFNVAPKTTQIHWADIGEPACPSPLSTAGET